MAYNAVPSKYYETGSNIHTLADLSKDKDQSLYRDRYHELKKIAQTNLHTHAMLAEAIQEQTNTMASQQNAIRIMTQKFKETLQSDNDRIKNITNNLNENENISNKYLKICLATAVLAFLSLFFFLTKNYTPLNLR